MTVLYVEQLLTTDGWLKSARVHLLGERIAKIEADALMQPGDERHAVIVPAMSNLHSHAFQRGMAGLAEARGPARMISGAGARPCTALLRA